MSHRVADDIVKFTYVYYIVYLCFYYQVVWMIERETIQLDSNLSLQIIANVSVVTVEAFPVIIQTLNQVGEEYLTIV